ncbi:MAG: FGGY family carbohydrate kinase [Spirochaetota bacterium]
MDRAVAVIDIGMTNKKVAVYGPDLKPLASESRVFAPHMVDEIPTHDLAGMEDWFLGRLAEFGKKYPIKSITVTTHGATMVCVGADGLPSAPCVQYTYEPGGAFQKDFYRLAGDPMELQAVTGTPVLSALINPAKGLYFVSRRFPGQWKGTGLILALPSYWGYRFTGKAGAEGTYVANHSYLWDWEKDDYSSVTDALGARSWFPTPLRKSWDSLGPISPEVAKRTGLSKDTIVTMGIHDSNASLLPHLAKRGDRAFVLNSTGTWCVLMHPQKRYQFAEGELGKVVFFNRSAYLEPIKTAIFLGGMEYEAWTAPIAMAAGSMGVPGSSGAASPAPASDSAAAHEGFARLFAAKDNFILPEVVPGSGQFPGSKPRAIEARRSYSLAEISEGKAKPAFLSDRAIATAALDASLVIQTIVALRRAGLEDGMDVITEGGFRKNGEYNALLAAALPRNSCYLTDIAEATSFGAAMCGMAALEGKDPSALAGRFEVEYRPVQPMEGIAGFEAYRGAWQSQVDSGIGTKGDRE